MMGKLKWIFSIIVIAGLLVAGFKFLRPVFLETSAEHPISKLNIHYFSDVEGPQSPTVVAEEEPTPWNKYSEGTNSRVAILLTDKDDKTWMGLAHGLKSIGVPFIITTDYRKALRHNMVIAHPLIPGKLYSKNALEALNEYPRRGGTLIGMHVAGGGLFNLFGFEEPVPSKEHSVIQLQNNPLTADLQDKKEKVISLGDRGQVGVYAYKNPSKPPLATFMDGTAAITQREFPGGGAAYAFSMNLGHFLSVGFNNSEESISRTYVNDYEPSLDVLLRLVKRIYLKAQPNAVTLWPVPDNKSLSVMITHDIDYLHSIKNAVDYAKFEKEQGIRGTYFVQTKYIKDFSDENFYNQDGVSLLKKIQAMGMEVASHSVSHSFQFEFFDKGTGQEKYPTYVPFVLNKTTTHNGTVLGELRVSKFLLENFLPNLNVKAFRPGHLANPRSLPESLMATGYKYSSSVTANNSLTHLPFRLNVNRGFEAESDIYEFPVTVEDEALPKMGDRVDEAVALAKKIARYGGSFVVLIHPDILDHKLQFERDFVKAVRPFSWFGSLSDFGHWWAARDKVTLDVSGRQVTLNAPETIEGLTLDLPTGWTLSKTTPQLDNTRQEADRLVLPAFKGKLTLQF